MSPLPGAFLFGSSGHSPQARLGRGGRAQGSRPASFLRADPCGSLVHRPGGPFFSSTPTRSVPAWSVGQRPAMHSEEPSGPPLPLLPCSRCALLSPARAPARPSRAVEPPLYLCRASVFPAVASKSIVAQGGTRCCTQGQRQAYADRHARRGPWSGSGAGACRPSLWPSAAVPS